MLILQEEIAKRPSNVDSHGVSCCPPFLISLMLAKQKYSLFCRLLCLDFVDLVGSEGHIIVYFSLSSSQSRNVNIISSYKDNVQSMYHGLVE